MAEKNPKVYMELLFWKTTVDAVEICEGYGTTEEKKKSSKSAWTEAEEDELRTLFMEHQTNKYPRGETTHPENRRFENNPGFLVSFQI